MKVFYYQHRLQIWLAMMFFLALSTCMYMWQVYELGKQQKEKTAMMQLLKDAPEMLVRQKDSIQKMETLLSKQQRGSLTLVSHNEFIRMMEEACHTNHVRVLQVPQEEITSQQNFRVAKVNMKLEGTYKDLLRLMFMIENEKKIGKIQCLEMQVEEFSKNMEVKNYLTLNLSLFRLIENTNNQK